MAKHKKPERSLLEFFELVRSLKRIPRSGWTSRKVPLTQAESVAQHSFSTSILAMLLAEVVKREHKVDLEKTIKMALLHDVGEALTSDISKELFRRLDAGGKLKDELEKRATSYVLRKLPPKPSQEYTDLLINELKRGKSLEARIVHAADQLDVLMQIIDYESMGYARSLFDDLWDEARMEVKKAKLRLLDSLLEELEKRRNKLR
jgi:putative hydrolase of HD superfamily